MGIEWEYVQGSEDEDKVTPMEYVRAYEEGVDITPEVELFRASVPGGWLLLAQVNDDNHTMTFYPDPEHKWDGRTLPLSPNPDDEGGME